MKLDLYFNDNSITSLHSVSGLNLYRTLHPYPATHDDFNWPARPDDYPMPAHDPIAPNDGSFDVLSRLFINPNYTSDGGKIRLTENQWKAIQKKNNNNILFDKWAVGQNNISTRIMRWEDGYAYPVFHYPLTFGGNWVNVLETKGAYSRIETWPMTKDVPDNLPWYLWWRCWSVYVTAINPIRDAPLGGIATPAWMLGISYTDSAWIYNAGLLKY
jgi:hypothetical protein